MRIEEKQIIQYTDKNKCKREKINQISNSYNTIITYKVVNAWHKGKELKEEEEENWRRHVDGEI